MLVTFLRSSSIGAMHWCEHSHFIGSNLGLRRESGVAASVGSGVHKALELLAKQKQALVAGDISIYEPELAKSFRADATPDELLEASLQHYSKEAQWDDEAWDRARKWLHYTLEFNDGRYDPRNLDVVMPEQFFDLEIREPWAWYDYPLPDGNRLKGYLRIKGTVDLLVREQPGLLHYIDWKTGKRVNWATKREKGTADLRKDPQFLMYYYALRRLYPDDQIYFTVFFTQAGGPFPLCFDDSDIQRALDMLKQQFQLMQGTTSPSLAEDTKSQQWKCKRCSYHDEPYKDSGLSICHHFRNKLVELGMQKVLQKHGDFSSLSKYGAGGGATHTN